MSWFHNTKIDMYRWVTLPYRYFRLQRQIETGHVPIVVLYYHRVADTNPTPWTISQSDFQRQLDWLQENFELLSMDQVHQRLQTRCNHRPAVALTFDDGYAENMDFALPMMAQRGIKCMYYVSTSPVLNQTLFEHDRSLSLHLLPNSVSDLKQIIEWGFDIGSHTRNHLDIGSITSLRQLRDELEGSRRELLQLLNVPIDHFAFPFGQRNNISAASIAVAKSVGYKTVCGAYGGYNHIGCDPFFIQRMHGDPCLARVKNCVTLDPRQGRVAPEVTWLHPPAGQNVQASPEASDKADKRFDRRSQVSIPSALLDLREESAWTSHATFDSQTHCVSTR